MLFTVSGFILGIFIGSFVKMSAGLILAILVLCVILFFYNKNASENVKHLALCGAFLFLGVFLGFTRIYFSDLNQESKLAKFENRIISAEGIIVEEPDVRENNAKLTVKITRVGAEKVSEKILVTTGIYPEYNYGDKIKLEKLKLSEPEEIESDSGRIFDYGGYLRVRGIWYTANFSKITLVESGHGSFIKTILFKIKKSFTNSLNNAIMAPESALMSGLLLGTKQSLGKDLLSEFSRAGVSHVVVLSGYNIAIVATSIMSFLSFLPATFSFAFGCAGIVLFTILSGGGASAVRAAIMVLVALFAKRFGRDYKAGRALGFAVVLMLAPNPLLLVFDPSFQLSILATIGIVFVSSILAPYFSRVPEKFGLREIVSSTIATQLTVLPFLVYSMGTLSLVALPVNILILATIPTTMFLGFVTGLFGLVSLWLSFIPALPSYVLLWYQLTIVHLGAILPFGAISLPTFSPFVLIIIYVIIGGGLYFLQKKTT